MSYPYASGYCSPDHVAARVLGGQWNPSTTGQTPNTAQVNDWIAEASADIDMRLARAGYTIPLTLAPGFSAIGEQVWLHLRTICAELVAGYVQRARHGSYDPQGTEAKESQFHFTLADDMLSAIEDGATNLTVFGVAGPFEPDVDPAKAVVIPVLNDSTTGLPQTARFTDDMLSQFDPR